MLVEHLWSYSSGWKHQSYVLLKRHFCLDVNFEFFPEFDLIFKGSDALERKGAYYTFSDMDHPITKLMQSPYKVPRRSNVLISLSTRQVLFDKSHFCNTF